MGRVFRGSYEEYALLGTIQGWVWLEEGGFIKGRSSVVAAVDMRWEELG